MAIVAFLELSNSDPDLGEVLEDAPMKDLLWSKYPSVLIPGKTTASSQPRSRLRKKQRNYYAYATRQHRRNEWAQWRADEAHRPAPLRYDQAHSLVVIVTQESAEPFVTLDCSTLQSKTAAVSVASYF